MGRFFTKDGFTLVELILVIVILGILSSVLVAKLDPFGQINKSHDAKRQFDLTQLKIALDAYYNDHNRYPPGPGTLGELTLGSQPYIKALPKDPSTQSDYIYAVDNDNPHWNVLFAKLSKAPSTQNACPLTSLDNCLPTGFACATWACSISGKVDCEYLTSSSFSLPCTGIIPTSTPAPSSTPTPTPLPTKRVFITSTKYTGNLGGLSGADTKCQARADDPDSNPATADGLGGAWKAWLSQTTGNAAIDRLAHFEGHYVLVDGTTVVADNWEDLTNGSLDNPINKNEFGRVQSDAPLATLAWTGTHWDGTKVGGTCFGWANQGTRIGKLGAAESTTGGWTNEVELGCNNRYHLYCFEQ